MQHGAGHLNYLAGSHRRPILTRDFGGLSAGRGEFPATISEASGPGLVGAAMARNATHALAWSLTAGPEVSHRRAPLRISLGTPAEASLSHFFRPTRSQTCICGAMPSYFCDHTSDRPSTR